MLWNAKTSFRSLQDGVACCRAMVAAPALPVPSGLTQEASPASGPAERVALERLLGADRLAGGV
jgi:hypothetical protein